jgi:hypothetical protein
MYGKENPSRCIGMYTYMKLIILGCPVHYFVEVVMRIMGNGDIRREGTKVLEEGNER